MKKSEESAKDFKTLLTSLLLFCITGICVSMLLAVLGTVLVLTEALLVDYISHFSAFSVFVGSFVASMLSCKKLGKPLYTALASAVFLILILFLTGALLYGRALPESSFILILAAAFLGSLLGAILSAGKKRRKKSKK